MLANIDVQKPLTLFKLYTRASPPPPSLFQAATLGWRGTERRKHIPAKLFYGGKGIEWRRSWYRIKGWYRRKKK